MTKKKLFRITTIPLSLFSLLKGQMQFMSSFFEVKGITSSGELIQEVEKNEGVPIQVVEMTRTISPFKDLRSVWELYHIFRKEKPYIVHTHTPKAGTVGMLAAKLAKVPHRLHTVAGLPLLETGGNMRKLLNLVERVTYACATRVYPNSRGLYDLILENNFTSREKMKVICEGSSNGINTNFFDPINYSSNERKELREKLGISDEDFVFIYVGRLVSDKGVNELLYSFDELSFKYSNLKLLLVGFQESTLDPLAESSLIILEKNKNVKYIGFKKDVRPYFSISDALVFPSYREGFPNVVMQAGAMGIPSIVSNINGCNEIIIEGENGLIVPSKNVTALYDAMLKLLDNEQLRKKLRSNSRRMIVERYEQQIVWEGILAEYKRLDDDVQKRD